MILFFILSLMNLNYVTSNQFHIWNSRKPKKSLLVTFPRGIQYNSISVKDTECVITLNTIEHSVYDPQDNPVQIQD